MPGISPNLPEARVSCTHGADGPRRGFRSGFRTFVAFMFVLANEIADRMGSSVVGHCTSEFTPFSTLFVLFKKAKSPLCQRRYYGLDYDALFLAFFCSQIFFRFLRRMEMYSLFPSWRKLPRPLPQRMSLLVGWYAEEDSCWTELATTALGML